MSDAAGGKDDGTNGKLDAIAGSVRTFAQDYAQDQRDHRAEIKELRVHHDNDVQMLHSRINKTREQIGEQNGRIMEAIAKLREDAIRAAGKPWMWLVLAVGTVSISGVLGWAINVATEGGTP